LGQSPDIRVVTAGEMEPDEVSGLVAFVVNGGRLLVQGGAGRLLNALHLIPRAAAVQGPVQVVRPGLAQVADTEACPVSGVGFALYRIGESCIALGGPRGQGVVAYVGSENPPTDLATGCLEWLAGN